MDGGIGKGVREMPLMRGGGRDPFNFDCVCFVASAKVGDGECGCDIPPNPSNASFCTPKREPEGFADTIEEAGAASPTDESTNESPKPSHPAIVLVFALSLLTSHTSSDTLLALTVWMDFHFSSNLRISRSFFSCSGVTDEEEEVEVVGRPRRIGAIASKIVWRA